jgi:hypothetical protein
MRGWIGVDLDGTLAHYDRWRGIDHIGEPIAPMLSRVKRWLAEGRDVRIFTARIEAGTVRHGNEIIVRNEVKNVAETIRHIQNWTELHLGVRLPVTNRKDNEMLELWDDRAVQVERNTGRRMDSEPDPEHWTP